MGGQAHAGPPGVGVGVISVEVTEVLGVIGPPEGGRSGHSLQMTETQIAVVPDISKEVIIYDI